MVKISKQLPFPEPDKQTPAPSKASGTPAAPVGRNVRQPAPCNRCGSALEPAVDPVVGDILHCPKCGADYTDDADDDDADDHAQNTRNAAREQAKPRNSANARIAQPAKKIVCDICSKPFPQNAATPGIAVRLVGRQRAARP